MGKVVMARCVREWLYIVGIAAFAFFAILHARVYADWPNRPITIIVHFAPGGANDLLGRLIAAELSPVLHQNVIVVNRPGANGNIGAQAAANASSDGYTLLLVGVPNALNAAMNDKANFSPIRDIAPVSPISRTPFVVVVNLAVPVTTIPEFIA